MNYHSILKNYNFTYSLLLEKLIEKIKYFLEIKIITKDIIYDLKISDVQINYITLSYIYIGGFLFFY